jgi:hypothetical protein
MYQDFHRALRNIGISDDEIAERHLHLHGWRHFFNTELLKGGLTIPQTQAVTGHKSERMTEWYLHFDPAEFAQARMVQEGLLAGDDDGPGAAGSGKKGNMKGTVMPQRKHGEPAGKVIKIPGRAGARKQKRA